MEEDSRAIFFVSHEQDLLPFLVFRKKQPSTTLYYIWPFDSSARFSESTKKLLADIPNTILLKPFFSAFCTKSFHLYSRYPFLFGLRYVKKISSPHLKKKSLWELFLIGIYFLFSLQFSKKFPFIRRKPVRFSSSEVNSLSKEEKQKLFNLLRGTKKILTTHYLEPEMLSFLVRGFHEVYFIDHSLGSIKASLSEAPFINKDWIRIVKYQCAYFLRSFFISSAQQTDFYVRTIAPKNGGMVTPEGIQEKIICLGRPRVDLCNQQFSLQTQEECENIIPGMKNKKMILYAPTFRNSLIYASSSEKIQAIIKQNLLFNQDNLKDLGETLQKEYHFVLKLHSWYQRWSWITGLDYGLIQSHQSSFFTVLSPEKQNILDYYSLLNFADVVITDYSSIAFDAALYGKKVIFYSYDLQDYQKEVGLNKDTEWIFTSSLATSDYQKIPSIIKNYDLSLLTKLKEYASEFQDTNSCKRITKYIGI